MGDTVINYLTIISAITLILYGVWEASGVILKVIMEAVFFIYMKFTDSKALLGTSITKKQKRLEKLASKFFGYEVRVSFHRKRGESDERQAQTDREDQEAAGGEK